MCRGGLSFRYSQYRRYGYISDMWSRDFSAEFPNMRRLYKNGFVEVCLVKGDSKVFSVACASVLAKVSRDRLIADLDKLYPAYSFAQHKGYSTSLHMEMLREFGPCSEHRLSFGPVSPPLELFS